MIETKRDKIKDYIIAILLVIIAILLGLLYSKELMDKNMDDRSKIQTTTRKQISNYFENLDANGYVLNDFSTSANFDYNLGKVKLFNKEYEITITNTHSECNPDCKYMYEIGTTSKTLYKSNFLAGIKTGVIGNYIAIQEIYENDQMQLILIRPNDGYVVQSYYFYGTLNITYAGNIFNIMIKQENCDTNTYKNTTIIYNKNDDTFEKNEVITEDTITGYTTCTGE